MQAAVQSEQQAHRVLRDGVGRIRRHADDVQLFVGCFDIHIAVARAAHGDDLHAVFIQPVDGLGIDVVVYKGAHGVKAIGEFRGVVVQLFLKVGDLVIAAEPVKPDAVIGLCIEKCDLFHVQSPFRFLSLVCTG